MPPPRCRNVFRVGVSGHCPDQLPANFEKVFEQPVSTILSTLKNAFKDCTATDFLLADRLLELRVVSCLAEGTDRLIAKVGIDQCFDLHAILPFTIDECRADFENDESRKQFNALIQHERCLSVLEIDGDRATLRDQSYEAAGRMVIQQSDLLIAVWNGLPPRGQGGTGQIVAEAVQIGIPVVWICSLDPAEFRWLARPEDLIVPNAPVSVEVMQDPIRKYVASFLALPTKQQTLAMRYFDEVEPTVALQPIWRGFLELLTAVGPEAPASFEAKPIVQSTANEWHVECLENSREWLQYDQQVEKKLLGHFAWADKLAEHYTAIYRASFLLNYTLAVFAIIFALLASPLGWNSLAHPQHNLSTVLTIAEAFALILILLNTFSAKLFKWHERALEYRLLAEWLRQYRFLLPLAGGRISAKTPQHLKSYGQPEESWMHWQLRAIIREAGVLRARFNTDFLTAYRDWTAKTLLLNQASYHADIVTAVHKANHVLHLVGVVFFAASLFVCLLHFVEHSEWLPFFSAVLPALGTACFAIRVHGEFEKVVKTSAAMRDSLTQAYDAFSKIHPNGCQLNSLAMGRSIRSATFAMNEEVLSWVTAFKDRPVELP